MLAGRTYALTWVAGAKGAACRRLYVDAAGRLSSICAVQVCGQLLLNLRLWHAAGPRDQLRILTVISRLIQVRRRAQSAMLHAMHASGS